MAQFDVYVIANEKGMIFVDLQSGAVDEFNTRLLAPLIPVEPGLKPIRRVNRELLFDSRTYIFMSAVRTRDLDQPIGT